MSDNGLILYLYVYDYHKDPDDTDDAGIDSYHVKYAVKQGGNHDGQNHPNE